jgi:Predicted amino acid aldolase or racemase
MPGGIAPTALGEIGKQGWNLLREDLPLPLAVIRQQTLAHNGDWMRRFLARSGAVIAPHGKTTMSPQLFKRQIDDGAWGITIGSVQQLQAIRHAGVGRVVMANQLLGKRAIRYVLEELARDPDSISTRWRIPRPMSPSSPPRHGKPRSAAPCSSWSRAGSSAGGPGRAI